MSDTEPLAGYDLGGLDPIQIAVLRRTLDEAGITNEVIGGELQARSAEGELVDALIARAAGATGDDDHDRPLFADIAIVDDVPVVLGPFLARRGRRFAAYLIESIAFTALVLGIRHLSHGAARVVGLGLGLGSGVLLVALAGGTVGMLVLGQRVVDAGVGPTLPSTSAVAPIGWGRTIVRYLVVSWPGLVYSAVDLAVAGSAPTWMSRVVSLWVFACFGPILFDPWCRGLHDRVARTLVVDVREIRHLRE